MSATLLTAHQVQELLDVDASTVYRMAGDGRLPAVRVGRQWRFPADAIDRLLVPARHGSSAADPGAGLPMVPPQIITALLETVGPALGVTMVATDMAGRPLTPVVNPAPFIANRLDDPGFIADCVAEWGRFASEQYLAPQLRPGRMGFLCAHSFVRRGSTLVAMILAGGIAPDTDGDQGLFGLEHDARQRVLDALPRTSALVSRLAAESAWTPRTSEH